MRFRTAVAALALCAIWAGGARAEPDPSKILLYNLLDLDQRELFEPQQHSPMAELNAWSDLYIRLRDQAQSDATDDRRHLKSFLLMGWIARAKGQFATVESFNTDFMRLFEARPDDTLRVMAEEDFLAPEMCTYLAKFFFFENGDPAKREPWMGTHRVRLESILGGERAKLCLEAFWRVTK
jgi:hypothetical protein